MFGQREPEHEMIFHKGFSNEVNNYKVFAWKCVFFSKLQIILNGLPMLEKHCHANNSPSANMSSEC